MNTSAIKKQRSSSPAFLRRKSSTRKSKISKSSSKQSNVSNEKSFNDGQVTVEFFESPPHKTINYRKELTFLFFNSMFENIIFCRNIEIKVLKPNNTTTIISNSNNKGTSENAPGEELKSTTSTSNESKNLKEVSSKRLAKKKRKSQKSLTADSITSKTISIREDHCRFPESHNLEGRSNFHKSTPSLDAGGDWIIELEDRKEKINFKNGNVYEGQTSQGIMHGNGIFNWADGAVYEGCFNNGYPSGQGVLILPDLSKYEGEFLKNYFHGRGSLAIASSSIIYSGSWENGKKHGKGWILYCTNDLYNGDWFEDQKHGFGVRQYKNKAKYRGQWQCNKKYGKGNMIWENNDYYVGEWDDDKPHGYGKYTWKIFFNDSFTFPYYNWYKGSWVNGVREGVGLLNFGTRSGAKLAGTWRNNQKHGPGIMVCGNGLISQYNPLFENDKSVHMYTKYREMAENQPDAEAEDDENSEPSDKEDFEEEFRQAAKNNNLKISQAFIFQWITKQINSKKLYYKPFQRYGGTGILLPEPTLHKSRTTLEKISLCSTAISIFYVTFTAMKALDPDILKYITYLGFISNQKRFFKLADSISGNKKQWAPLEIPIHTVAERLDLSYYIDIIMVYIQNLPKSSNIEVDSTVSGITQTSISSKLCRRKPTSRESTENSRWYKKKREEILLRSLVTIYLPQLTELYNKYANCASHTTPKFKTVLVRLFVWQFFRDIQVSQNGVSLVEVDIFFSNNPSSCTESVHNPFEPIYFWQFVLYLIGCSWLFSRKYITNCIYGSGIIGGMFKEFLEDVVFPRVTQSQGTALKEHRDLLPIKSVYDLYLNVGDTHTVRDFLFFTCTKKEKDPPCYYLINGDDKAEVTIEGSNAVPIAYKIMYLPAKEDFLTEKPPPQEENPDPFKSCLYTFRNLGKKKITNCLNKICAIIDKFGNVNLDYKLTFLEFYEAILLCAYEKVEISRIVDEVKQCASVHSAHTISSMNIQKTGKDKVAKKKKK